MFGLNTKSLIVGLLIGYFVAPRLVGPIVAKLAALKGGGAA
jgi:hypothetical protein